MVHWPGKDMSAAKRPWPVRSGRSSSRGTDRPMNFCFADMSSRSSFSHVLRRRSDRLDDVLVARAAAKVGRKNVEQVFVADVGLALEHADREHQKTRRAE